METIRFEVETPEFGKTNFVKDWKVNDLVNLMLKAGANKKTMKVYKVVRIEQLIVK